MLDFNPDKDWDPSVSLWVSDGLVPTVCLHCWHQSDPHQQLFSMLDPEAEGLSRWLYSLANHWTRRDIYTIYNFLSEIFLIRSWYKPSMVSEHGVNIVSNVGQVLLCL